jgi:hypothetical protein
MDSRIEDEVPQCFRAAETSGPLVLRWGQPYVLFQTLMFSSMVAMDWVRANEARRRAGPGGSQGIRD